MRFGKAAREQFASVWWFAATVACCAVAIAIVAPSTGARHDEHFAQAMLILAVFRAVAWFALVSSFVGVLIAWRTSKKMGRTSFALGAGLLCNGSLLLLSLVALGRSLSI